MKQHNETAPVDHSFVSAAPVESPAAESIPQKKRRAPRKAATSPRKRKTKIKVSESTVAIAAPPPLQDTGVVPVEPTLAPLVPLSLQKPVPVRWVSQHAPPNLPVPIEIVPGKVAACHDLFVGGFIRMIDGRMVPTEDPRSPSIMVPRQELMAAKMMVQLQGFSTLVSVNKNDPTNLANAMGMRLVCLHFDPSSPDTLTSKTLRDIISLINDATSDGKKCLITGSSSSNIMRYLVTAYLVKVGWSLKAASKMIENDFFPVAKGSEKVIPDPKSSATALRGNATMWKNLEDLAEWELKRKIKE